jgi:hypothetical protein
LQRWAWVGGPLVGWMLHLSTDELQTWSHSMVADHVTAHATEPPLRDPRPCYGVQPGWDRPRGAAVGGCCCRGDGGELRKRQRVGRWRLGDGQLGCRESGWGAFAERDVDYISPPTCHRRSTKCSSGGRSVSSVNFRGDLLVGFGEIFCLASRSHLASQQGSNKAQSQISFYAQIVYYTHCHYSDGCHDCHATTQTGGGGGGFLHLASHEVMFG